MVRRLEEIRRRLSEGRDCARSLLGRRGCSRDTAREVRDGLRDSPDAPKTLPDPLRMLFKHDTGFRAVLLCWIERIIAADVRGASMDPLSDVLSLLKLRTYAAAGLGAGGPWSLQYSKHEGIKCYALLSGRCWLSVDNVPDPVRLETGDCLLLPSSRPFRIASDLASTPVDAHTIFLAPGSIHTLNGGGDCFGFGGHFSLSGDHAGVLLRMLPPIIHLKQEADKTALRWSLEQMMQELREPRPGGFLVLQQLASMMLVKALRLYLSQGLSGGVGCRKFWATSPDSTHCGKSTS
jgi:hypothetical protein